MGKMKEPVVGIIMGSDSDLPVMEQAGEILDEFEIPYEVKITSAHRTPDYMASYSKNAYKRGIKVIIAGAGGAAHLPGMSAAYFPYPCNRRSNRNKVIKRNGFAVIHSADALRCARSNSINK